MQTTPESPNYTDARYNFLKNVEGDYLYAYADGKGIPTIGIGINLRVHTDMVLKALGFDVDGNKLTGAASTAEQNYISQLKTAFGQTYAAGTTKSNAALVAFNKIMKARLEDTAYQGVANLTRKSTFEFANNTETKDLFNLTMDGYTGFAGYEATLNTKLGYTLAQSKERIAIVSLNFNTVAGAKDLIGAGLKNGLQFDRAEAWYEIRYGSNGGGDRKGVAKRRYAESTYFGLYDDSTGKSAAQLLEEHKGVLRTYTRHFDAIQAYEKLYGYWKGTAGSEVIKGQGVPLDAANTWATGVKTIDASIADARNAVIAEYAPSTLGITVNGEVFVGNDVTSGPNGKYKADDNIKGTKDNDLILGDGGVDKLDGGEGTDILLGGSGDDELTGGADDDVLIGGKDKDTLQGGEGSDRYIYSSGDGEDTIIDSDGKGSIIIGGVTVPSIATESFMDNGRQIWENSDKTLKYSFTGDDVSKGGTLKITGSALGGDGNKITIKDFKNDQLGITLNTKKKVEIKKAEGTANPFDSSDHIASHTSAEMTEGGAQALKVFLNGPAKTGDKIQLAATGAGGLAVITGAETIPLTDTVTLELTEGQTEISFAVWSKDTISSDQAASLTATFIDGTGGASDATSSMDLTIHDDGVSDFQDPQTASTISGDLHPIDFDPPNQTYHYDDLGNVINDGSPEVGRSDVLYDSAGNDLILAGGGDDYVNAFRGGDDVLDGGDGNDEMNAGASNDWLKGGAGRDVLRGEGGNDLLEGGADADILYGHEGNDRLFGGEKIAVDEAIAQGAAGIAGVGQGEFLQGVEGNDTVGGGDKADLISGGDDNDTLIGGLGDDFITGDALYSAYTNDWTVTVQVDGNKTLYMVDGASLLSEGNGGADAIYAGDGNDGVLAEGGDDFVDAGNGNDKVWGDDGNDIIQGGNGDDQLSGDNGIEFLAESLHGDDFIDGGDGNDLIIGNGGNDVLLGGSGDDEISGDSNDLLQPGQDYLDGEDGNDTLIGGGADDTLYGGAGDDFLNGDASDIAIDQHGSDQLFGEDGNDELNGGSGDDYLDGGSGDDTLFGCQGEDLLFGDDGNDTLVGDDGANDVDGGQADYLDGEAGDDKIFGQGGDDTLMGGTGDDTLQGGDGEDDLQGDDGNDLLFGEKGADSLAGGTGDDQLSGGEGDDNVDGGDGNDILFGEEGNDQLSGGDGNDQLQGCIGDDILIAGDGSNVMNGEDGDDLLIGGAQTDYLIGGAGNDTLSGGDGDDVYFYDVGDGIDHISDSSGTDWLVLGNGATINNIRLDVGSLKLVFSDGGELHLDDFDPNNPTAGAIEYIQFSDGLVMTRQQLIQTLGFKIEGTPGEDSLTGTALGDTIHAYDSDDTVVANGGDDTVDLGGGDDWADVGDGNDVVYAADGNDTVFGGNGNDLLNGDAGTDSLFGESGNDHHVSNTRKDKQAGGMGNDLLEGGEGDDSYRFGIVDGQDIVVDNQGSILIQLDAGITVDQITFRRQGADLILAINGTTDNLTVRDWFITESKDWAVALDDGTYLNSTDVESRLVTNQAPTLAEDYANVREDVVTVVSGNALSNDFDPEGRALRVTNTGTINGTYGTLTLNSNGAYTYALDNASAAVQALAAGQTVTEHFGYSVTDDDPAGPSSATSTIHINITGTNDMPVVNPDGELAFEDYTVSVSGNVLDNDSDVDAGTVLQVAVPGTFAGQYGTLDLSADGAYVYTLNNDSLAVQSLGSSQGAVDRFNYATTDGTSSVNSYMDVEIWGNNDAPIVSIPLPDQTVSTNAAYTWQIPVDSFTDIDQTDVLTYSATLADGSDLPAWLTFDASTRTFSGRVPKDATGYLDF